MPNRSDYTYATNAYGYTYPATENHYGWARSPRDAEGKLILQANPMARHKYRVELLGTRGRHPDDHDRQAIYGAARLRGDPQTLDTSFNNEVRNKAYRKLVSYMRGDTASMGISLAFWKQSWTMIAKRAGQIRKIASEAEQKARRENRRREALRRAYYSSRGKKRKGKAQKLRPKDFLPVGSANIFLEGMFGWLPLVSDIHSTFKVLVNHKSPGTFIRGRSRGRKTLKTLAKKGTIIVSDVATLELRVTQACFVKVSNPNAWLLNKLGLINPAVVIWDAIPWSFAVNWFSNINHVAASFTDFAGLTVSNGSTTSMWTVTEASQLSLPGYKPGDFGYMEENRIFVDTVKSRTLGITLPKLQLRQPSADMGLALIQLSLLTQQIGRLEYFKKR